MKRKTNNSSEKLGTDLNKQFSIGWYQMSKKKIKKMVDTHSHQQKQIKTTLKFDVAPVRMAKTKSRSDSLCWIEQEAKAHSSIVRKRGEVQACTATLEIKKMVSHNTGN